MVMYSYDTNEILVHPMKIKTGAEISQVYDKIFRKLTASGFRIRVHPSTSSIEMNR